MTVHNIDEVLGGALDELVEALVDAERDARLEELAAGGAA